ncbi:MAG: hypothetical protein PHX21_13900 [bacterium]|nr:hypothetical protein [bacterium]
MLAKVEKVNIPQTAISWEPETEEEKKIVKELEIQKCNQLRASFSQGKMYIIVPYGVMKTIPPEKKPVVQEGVVQTDNKFTKKGPKGQGNGQGVG